MAAETGAFDWLCNEVEAQTSLDKLEARGTVRIALKQAGLEARSVTASQLSVVVEKILPDELSARSVDDADAVCSGLKGGLAGLQSADSVETPESVFERLGG